MGTDINMHSQVKNNGQWVWYDQNIYNERNYYIFNILCGVRRNENHKPIALIKGFPSDSHDKLRENHNYDTDDITVSGVYLGYAGVSYLSLTELKSFNWNQSYDRNNLEYGIASFKVDNVPVIVVDTNINSI